MTVSRWLRLELAAQVSTQVDACVLLEAIARQIRVTSNCSLRSDQPPTEEQVSYHLNMTGPTFHAKSMLRLDIIGVGDRAAIDDQINTMLGRLIKAVDQAYSGHTGLALSVKALRHPEEE